MTDPTAPAIYVYSRTGHTERAARALAAKTGATLIAIDVNRYRWPLLWVAQAILDVGRKRFPETMQDMSNVDLRPWVVVAGPVWAGQPAPPVAATLQQLAKAKVPVAILTTSGNATAGAKAWEACEDALGRRLAGMVNVDNKVDGTPDMDARLASFAEALPSVAKDITT